MMRTVMCVRSLDDGSWVFFFILSVSFIFCVHFIFRLPLFFASYRIFRFIFWLYLVGAQKIKLRLEFQTVCHSLGLLISFSAHIFFFVRSFVIFVAVVGFFSLLFALLCFVSINFFYAQ